MAKIHPATNEAIVGPTVEPIIHSVTNKAIVGPTVEIHLATNEAIAGPSVKIHLVTNKVIVRLTVKPTMHWGTSNAIAKPTVEIHPAINKAIVGPTVTDHLGIINVFNYNNPISMLQFSPYENNDVFEESFEDEENGMVIPETQLDNLDSVDNDQKMSDDGCVICKLLQFSPYEHNDVFEESFEDEENGTVVPETQLDNLDSDNNNQNMSVEGCMICKRDDNHDNLLFCKGCDGEHHTYCLNPPLHLVPEDDFLCKKCKEAGKDDGIMEIIEQFPNTYSGRLGEIVWVDRGQ